MADGAHLFGKRLTELTREEAIAAAAQGWSAEKRARDEGMRQFEFMSALRQRRPSGGGGK